MWNPKKNKNKTTQAHRYRVQIGGCQGWDLGGQAQTSSYKNK